MKNSSHNSAVYRPNVLNTSNPVEDKKENLQDKSVPDALALDPVSSLNIRKMASYPAIQLNSADKDKDKDLEVFLRAIIPTIVSKSVTDAMKQNQVALESLESRISGIETQINNLSLQLCVRDTNSSQDRTSCAL